MATVLDIAEYILQRRGPMTAMKLQKLVYYCQAWSLALRKKPMFHETIQAWAHGPVVYELFAAHRGQYAVTHLPGDPAAIGPDDRTLVDSVVAHYGTKSGAQLSVLTHSEEPWRAARSGCGEGQPGFTVISHASMLSFYSSLPTPFPAT